jgi:hypothetical protein
MPMTKRLVLVALALWVLSGAARADDWFQLEPMIWKTVYAKPGETPWQTCRRYFRYDVQSVAKGPGKAVGCYVPYYYIYSPNQIRKNFNN